MLLTFSITPPVLAMFRVDCPDKPTITLPKFKLPLTAMTGAMPTPEAASVLVPLNASDTTVTVPL
jgi:hypothetical protein